MKFVYVLALSSVLFAAGLHAQEPEKTIEERAEEEADRLQRVLELEDWQVFYVDSTLKHDYPAMMAEYENLRTSKVANASLYQDVQDKWMDRIDASYRRIFNEDQWATYLKSGAGRAQKAREKRRARAAGL